MLETSQILLHDLIGTTEEIVWWQMLIRAFMVFIVGLILIKVGGKRMFGEFSTFDILLWVVLGSILGRAVTGNAPFFASVLTAIFLALLHRVLAISTFYYSFLGKYLKGKKVILIKEGKIQEENMKDNQISRNDLEQAIRLHGNHIALEKIKEAYLERNGEISIIDYDE